MAWTTPRTWVSGEVVSASMLNTHVRDNMNYLYGNVRMLQRIESIEKTANTSGSSTTYADVADLTLSITTTGGRLHAYLRPPHDDATGVLQIKELASTSGWYMYVSLLVGFHQVGSFYIGLVINSSALYTHIGSWDYTPAAGTYTCKIQYLVQQSGQSASFSIGTALVVEEWSS